MAIMKGMKWRSLLVIYGHMDVFLLLMYASVTVNLTACTASHKSILTTNYLDASSGAAHGRVSFILI